MSKNMEMSALARMAGISSSYLGMIERGSRVANSDVLTNIAAHLGVTTNDLLGADLSTTATSLWKQLVEHKSASQGGFARKLKALRGSRRLSVRALCEGADGAQSGLKAWLVREFEIGARIPSDEEMMQLAGAFGFATAVDLQAALDSVGNEDLIRSDDRNARRLAYDRASEDWPEMVLRATSKGFTSDQIVIEGRSLGWNFVSASAKILADRSVKIEEGDLVLVLNRTVVTGIGRIKDGVARDEAGAQLRGTPWRVVSMLFP